MTKKIDKELQANQDLVTREAFLEFYNQGIPENFSQVTIQDLKDFEAANPRLFKDSKLWSLDKHRKRLMDWLPRHSSHK
ncbi:MAG: hypothetical protein JW816_00125 [Candidatus Buchananbacteria bacterium]|nr:hypothetical protein [Candidatus Buchananbacteria bacterium]